MWMALGGYDSLYRLHPYVARCILFDKKLWTIRIRTMCGNRGDMAGVIKAEQRSQGRTIIRPVYIEEPTLQKPDTAPSFEGQFGGY